MLGPKSNVFRGQYQIVKDDFGERLCRLGFCRPPMHFGGQIAPREISPRRTEALPACLHHSVRRSGAPSLGGRPGDASPAASCIKSDSFRSRARRGAKRGARVQLGSLCQSGIRLFTLCSIRFDRLVPYRPEQRASQI